MRDGKTATLLLAIYTLNQHGVYTKKMITFPGPDFPTDLELPLSVYETPTGELVVTIEDGHPPLPEFPEEPDHDPPEPVVRLAAEETLEVVSRWHLPPLPATLPESPTAAERWKYLLEVLKQRTAD